MPYLLPVFASVLPFAAWVTERILPYPHLIEELAKASLVVAFVGNKTKAAYLAVVAGFCFAFTETVFYSFNIFPSGSLSTILARLTLTSLLHVTTYLLLAVPYKQDKKLILISLPLAIFVHFMYNRLI